MLIWYIYLFLCFWIEKNARKEQHPRAHCWLVWGRRNSVTILCGIWNVETRQSMVSMRSRMTMVMRRSEWEHFSLYFSHILRLPFIRFHIYIIKLVTIERSNCMVARTHDAEKLAFLWEIFNSVSLLWSIEDEWRSSGDRRKYFLFAAGFCRTIFSSSLNQRKFRVE